MDINVYTPADAFLYLARTDTIGFVQEQLADRFGDSTENEDVEFLDNVLESLRREINALAMSFNPERTSTYLNGVPLERISLMAGTEPRDDGSEEIVQHEIHHQIHPSGHMPKLGPGEVWADEARLV